MSVKTIFKVLLGTITVIAVSFVLIELFNISIVSMQIRSLSKISAQQACTLFTQETYKKRGTGGTVNLQNVLDSENNSYITGEFYCSEDERENWNALYVGNAKYRQLLSQLTVEGYTNTKWLLKGLDSNGNEEVGVITQNSTIDDILKQSNAAKVNMYYKEMYTAANLGIPYLDEDVTLKMFKWNLAKLFSNCDSNRILKDENGKQYVQYNGFRVYCKEATISIPNTNYKVYDLSNASNRNLKAKELYKDTGLVIKGTGANPNVGISTSIQHDIAGNPINDNALITTVKVDYTVPVSYEGITPFRKVFEYLWNNEVDGLDGTGGGEFNRVDLSNTYETQEITSNVEGVLPTTGDLVFTLVK